ncbi:hypothetical protein MRB53_028522 [Persea americana]|uniref:Uncharacterized protein n=1 Tax=Persea americana TaxID=3435 RepID=A0ACC2KGE5_PERAE|nr:hypothetical protein MRB53_028522 [Persea americana]
MLFHGGVPKHYWVEAFSTAVWLINRLPARVLDMKSPNEKLFGRIPDYGSLRIFGSRCFPYLWDYAKTKFDPRSLPCVFLGYSDQYKGYRCLYPPTGRVYTSRHVVFDETNFPFQEPGRLFMIANSTVDLTTFLKWFPGSNVDIMTTSHNASPPFIGPSYTPNIILGDNDNTRTHDSCDRVYSSDDPSPSGHDGHQLRTWQLMIRLSPNVSVPLLHTNLRALMLKTTHQVIKVNKWLLELLLFNHLRFYPLFNPLHLQQHHLLQVPILWSHGYNKV